VKLTEKQRQCLEYVAKGDPPPFKITTVESLARKGLVEHTSLGWRVTSEGRELLSKGRAKAPRTPPAKTSSVQKSAPKPKPRAKSRASSQALTRETRFGEPQLPRHLRPLADDVTVKDEAEAIFYFGNIDARLAKAWKRDVVMHEGPITIRRFLAPSHFDSTHYAYVDRRLLWYLKHDPSDPLGTKWEGYLRSAGDVPRGAIAVFVGLDVVAKKCPPQLADGAGSLDERAALEVVDRAKSEDQVSRRRGGTATSGEPVETKR